MSHTGIKKSFCDLPPPSRLFQIPLVSKPSENVVTDCTTRVVTNTQLTPGTAVSINNNISAIVSNDVKTHHGGHASHEWSSRIQPRCRRCQKYASQAAGREVCDNSLPPSVSPPKISISVRVFRGARSAFQRLGEMKQPPPPYSSFSSSSSSSSFSSSPLLSPTSILSSSSIDYTQ